MMLRALRRPFCAGWVRRQSPFVSSFNRTFRSAILTIAPMLAAVVSLFVPQAAFAGSVKADPESQPRLIIRISDESGWKRSDPYSPSRGRYEGDRWIPETEPDEPRRIDPTLDPGPRVERRPLPPPDAEPPTYRPDRRRDETYRDPPRRYSAPRRERPRYRDEGTYDPDAYERDRKHRGRFSKRDEGYSENEIVTAGHRFFGSVSQGLARAIQSVFQRSGRPNGYILGQDAGGSFVAGLRYGEGTLFTKRHRQRPVYWQGPSLGYDFGAEGSKVMVLVYNLRRPRDIYRRFGGVQGSAYLVGGVSVQLQKADDITLAPIRAGVGLRLGANVGYLKYTRRPTWNPF